MKKFFALTLLALTFSAAPVFAATFTDTVNFATNGTTVTEEVFPFFNYAANPIWTHDINDNIGGNSINDISIQNASLTLRYSRTNGANVNLIITSLFDPELWEIQDLGQLNSVGNSAANQTFNFGGIPLADLQADGIFNAFPRELTLDVIDLLQRDSFRIFSSTLTGDYEVLDKQNVPSSPEPATLLLVTAGLGFGMIKRKLSL